MGSPSKEAIEHFLHGQLEAWNSHDKERFFSLYREASPKSLTIEYVGRPLSDPWVILENMWTDHNASMNIEAVQVVINGGEAACYHYNHRPAANLTIKTIEIYAFKDGALDIRYFIDGQP
jgi:hypothetical protein